MDCHNNPLHQGECARIWRADDLGDVELLHEDGVESFYYRGAIHTAPAGHVVVFNPGEAHTGEGANEHGWRFRMFYLDSGLLRKAAEEVAGRPCEIPFFASPIIQNAETAAMLRSLHMSLEGSGTALERQSKFLWTFAQIAKRHADDPAAEKPLGDEKAVVRQVRQYLENHYTENVTLETIVNLSGLSAYHLIRVFRSETGLPPHAYLEQVRITRARQLLRKGNSIADVAFMTGFADQSHFSRHFKKMTGVTPGQYRRGAITYKTVLPPKAQAKPR
jgi:AraC-like DNA-binding protein